MYWTLTASAERKSVGPIDAAYFIFGDATQQITSENEEAASRFQNRRPHVTLYGPAAAEKALALRDVGREEALQKHGIDLQGEGGTQLVCSLSTLFVNIYAGQKTLSHVMQEAERTLESGRLALSMTFNLDWIEHKEEALYKLFNGDPMFLAGLPEMQVVVRSVP